VQTTLIPAGGAVMVEFHTEVPGSYVLVDHSIFRAFNKGALAILKADGPENLDLLRQGSRFRVPGRPRRACTSKARRWPRRKAHRPRHVDQGRADRRRQGSCSPAPAPPATRPTARAWPACSRRWPSPTSSLANPKRLVEIILHGLVGPVTVNGKDYNSVMPPMSQLTDDEVANISTYVLNSWGNPGGQMSKADAAAARAAKPANSSDGH
jgi:nitrite reductase (NO-forming)